MKTVLATGGTDIEELMKNAISLEYATQFQLNADITKYLLSEKLEITYDPLGTPTSMPFLTAITFDANYAWVTENNPIDPTFWVENTPPTTIGGSTPLLELHEFYDIYRRLNKIAIVAKKLKLSKEELKVLIDAESDLNITDLTTLPIDSVAGNTYFDSLTKFLNYIDWIKVRDILQN